MSCIIQQLRERSGNGLSMEKLRINVDDRVLVDKGKYSGHYGIVSQIKSDELTVLVQLERFPETSIQISFACLRDKGWKDVDYPVSRANDPVDW
jgi:transcription antitermination factor NusG